MADNKRFPGFREIKDELARNRILLNEIQKISGLGTWELEFGSKKVIWSDETYRILGVNKRTTVGSLPLFLSFIHPSDRREIRRLINDKLTKTSDYSFCCRIVSKRGRTKHVLCKGIFETDKGGKPIRLHGIIHDITEIKMLENRICISEMLGQENERERFSKELHDGLGQMLVSINLQLSAVEQPLRKIHPALSKKINSVNENVNTSLKEMRSISHNLSPYLLKKYGLIEAIRNIFKSMTGIQFKFRTNFDSLAEECITIILYRAIQELCSNIQKHSHATKASVVLLRKKEHILLVVEDNGVGFPVRKKQESGGIGLANIRNRMKMVNGLLNVGENKSGGGSRVELTIPHR